MNELTIKIWRYGIPIVKVEDGDFATWLQGQTMPYVEDDKNPLGWAYYSDYLRYINGLPIID